MNKATPIVVTSHAKKYLVRYESGTLFRTILFLAKKYTIILCTIKTIKNEEVSVVALSGYLLMQK